MNIAKRIIISDMLIRQSVEIVGNSANWRSYCWRNENVYHLPRIVVPRIIPRITAEFGGTATIYDTFWLPNRDFVLGIFFSDFFSEYHMTILLENVMYSR